MNVRLVSLQRHQTHIHRGGLRLAAGEEVAGAGGRVQERRFWYLRVQPQAGLGELDGVLVAGLAAARGAGDLWGLGNMLEKLAVLDLAADRDADAAPTLPAWPSAPAWSDPARCG
jgi:hypothetical protein